MAVDLNSLSEYAQRQILRKLGQTKGKQRANKFNARKDSRGAIRFDSQREAKRYDELMLLLKAGEIRKLKLQPQYTLQESYVAPDGERIRAIRYVADFCYERRDERDEWTLIVEDVKSRATATQVYRNKKKMMREIYGISVQAVSYTHLRAHET